MQEGREFSQAYYQRRIKANKMIRKINSKRRQIALLRVLLRLSIIFVIIFSLLFVLKLPNWHINQSLLIKGDKSAVKIIGNSITPTYKILDRIRQVEIPNKEIFRLNTSEMADNIRTLEPVRNVYIRRFWLPARLVVYVEEEYPIFTLHETANSNPTAIVSINGVLIGHEYMPLKGNFNTIKIINGGNYSDWTKERVEKILNAKEILEKYTGQKVLYIDFRNPDDIYFMMENVLLRTGPINLDFQKRTEALVSILSEIDEYKGRIEYIDLRWDSKYIKLKGSNSIPSNSEQ